MTHPTPTDAFGHPIHPGDTIVTTDKGLTGTPGLVQGRVTRFTPSGELVEFEVTAYGTDVSPTWGKPVRKARVRRVQVIRSAAQEAANAQVLAEAEAAGLIPEAVAQ
ncbi:hypothetical protein KGD82_16725 [Nocardiopsis eucommiae]|uniref:Uncharacterized protein n=1 Tax=Nocardiopsis eucommiae TaxID=2831970 RepID=A0A975L6P6_9ACTN|nr:hypothetical protein KGD82_16725 [Nocardiopsis eucommiae]